MTAQYNQIINFLRDLDSVISLKNETRLYLVGGAAITLLYDQENRTADLDFVDPPDIFMKNGGQNCPLAEKYRVYVSHLPEISFSVPADWKTRCNPLPLKFRNFKIFVASIEDIVLGKIARLEPKDFEDILGLKEKGLLDPKKLIARLRENVTELRETTYRNNAKLFFLEVFGLNLTYQKGDLKLARS